MRDQMRRYVMILAVLAVVTAGLETVSDAQTRRRFPVRQRSNTKKPSAGERTLISLTIITTDNTAALRARLWQPTLQKLNVRVRIRSGTKADKVGLRETKLGTFRKVAITGKLDRRGRLVFKDRAFARSEAPKLEEWIKELKTYGAQGAPDGKPLWGLTKTQFGRVYKALGTVVEKDVHGKKLSEARKLLNVPKDVPLRFSFDAKKSLAGQDPVVRKHVKGHSLGTALSLILRDAGLGFRPVRTPRGSIELVADPLDSRDDTWPVGWKPKLKRQKTAPKLFTSDPIELNKVKLLDIYHAMAVKTGVPVHFDYYVAGKKSMQPEKMVGSYPRSRMFPLVVLKRVSGVNNLTCTLKIDEKGQPFLWVTPFVPKSLKSK